MASFHQLHQPCSYAIPIIIFFFNYITEICLGVWECESVCVCVRELSVTFKEDEHHWSVKEITSNLIIIPPKNQPLNLIFNICPRRKFSVWTLSSRSCCTVALKPVKYVDSVFFKSCIYIFFWSKCVKQTGSGGCCSVGEKKKVQEGEDPRRALLKASCSCSLFV